MNKLHSTLLLSLAIILFASQSTNAAKFYKWTDGNGATHYTDTPPANQDDMNRDINAVQTTDFTPDVSTTLPKPQGKKKAEPTTVDKAISDNKKTLADNCKVHKQNQEMLNTKARIKIKGENGEHRFLTPEEIQQKKQESIDGLKNC